MNEKLQYEDYKNSFVGFIDILGFSQTVNSIDTQEKFDSVAKVLELLSNIADLINHDNNLFEDFNFTAISDSLIVTTPTSNETGLYGLIYILQILQYQLVAKEPHYLIRGYIVNGKVLHKNDFIFGKAYMAAFKGEESIGGPPRILIDPKVVDMIETHGTIKAGKHSKSAFALLIQDEYDGCWFIDYMTPKSMVYSIDTDQIKDERKEILRFTEEQIETNKKKIKIYPKYWWLRNYINKTEDKFFKNIDLLSKATPQK